MKKRRFVIEFDEQTAKSLARLAKLEERPKAVVVRRLIRQAVKNAEQPPTPSTN